MLLRFEKVNNNTLLFQIWLYIDWEIGGGKNGGFVAGKQIYIGDIGLKAAKGELIPKENLAQSKPRVGACHTRLRAPPSYRGQQMQWENPRL